MSSKKIGQWTLGQRIGRGGQAEVYEAIGLEGEPIRAIKLIRTQKEKKRSRFIQEVRKHLELSRINAPHIIPILNHNIDEFEAGGDFGYIVMPKAETTLETQEELLKGRIELSLEVFRGILNGVKEAHAVGIIHRDLKPSNILFLEKALRSPLISDFGICFIKGTPEELRLTDAQETVGARFFMAPEQERGGVVDVKETADIYALGKLLHYVIAGRTLYRENLEEAFLREELGIDPRLRILLDEILAHTIVYNPDKRIQTVEELIKIVDRVSGNLGGSPGEAPLIVPSSGPPAIPKLPSPPATLSTAFGGIRETYHQTINAWENKRVTSVKMEFDRSRQEFISIWNDLRPTIQNEPDKAPMAARNLIRGLPNITGRNFAMVRLKAVDLFQDFEKLLEFILRSSEGQAGYLAVHTVPHVLSGFHYMAASVAALHFESWNILSALLRTKFEWYYQSGRPLYDYGFDLSYFFHAEALRRKADEIHNLYREEMAQREVIDLLGFNPEELLNTYSQTQMIMCLRVAQEVQAGGDSYIFSDFGRFDQFRVIPLLERAYNNPEFASGLCTAFQETPEEWFQQLNDRLKIAKSFFKGAPYFWHSVSSFEPRK